MENGTQVLERSDEYILAQNSIREVFFFNQTLVDYFGRTQVIAQINEVGVYQLIRHGLCGTTGACTGRCDQIYVTVPLVVHPTLAGHQVTFSLFKIPGYCTCRVSANAGLNVAGMMLQGSPVSG
ncbi:hypothetical protein ElyMa_001255800 [Elysia marginata]|uniref:Phospholipid scramblase n=1 Tax=Elysia marginata TaxID=1093978 RepID=A0AAV4IHG9_9GAST|nr:hypothetical protein ElyMa_001255800 [Elysia marginata]